MTMELPQLPNHPEPRVMAWSELEKQSILEYGKMCYAAAIQSNSVLNMFLDVLDVFENKERSPFAGYIAAGLVKELKDAILEAGLAVSKVDDWRKYATEHEDTAQAVIERHRKEHESLLRLIAKDRKTIADLKDAQEANEVNETPNFIVSAVVVKKNETGFNTQNILYPINAVSREEAHGKVLDLIHKDFPEYSLHTICSYQLQDNKLKPLSNEQIEAGRKRVIPDPDDEPATWWTFKEGVRFAEACHGIKE